MKLRNIDDFLQINQYIIIDYKKRIIITSGLKDWIYINRKTIKNNISKYESGQI